jgi:hypothetical protein
MPDLANAKAGLMNHEAGEVHLYHKILAPLVVYTKDAVESALKLGYSLTYIAREFPKHVTRADGAVVSVKDEAEEKSVLEGK